MADNFEAMTELSEFLDEVKAKTEECLDSVIPAGDVEPRALHQAIRWSVFAGGKRLRPGILFGCGRVFGAGDVSLSRTAAAIEMIHTYSLIHDDLPAMDDDSLRRGKAACHVQFGEATAILAGDVLQTLAFGAIASDETLTAETRARLIVAIAEAAGTPRGMVSGQQLDLGAEGKSLPIDEIENIHRQKTGALISAAAISGAIIGDAHDTEIEGISRYADKLGLLFQVTDDLLDVTASTATLGKTAGKDAGSGKATYASHYGEAATRDLIKQILTETIATVAELDRDTHLLVSLASLIAHRAR